MAGVSLVPSRILPISNTQISTERSDAKPFWAGLADFWPPDRHQQLQEPVREDQSRCLTLDEGGIRTALETDAYGNVRTHGGLCPENDQGISLSRLPAL
jgi:hypothetical protein